MHKQASWNTLHIYPPQKIDYQKAWEWQTALFEEMRQYKLSHKVSPCLGHLLFCEHPPVFTIGKNGQTQNLLISKAQLEAEHIQLFETDRGGDITYHGWGQLVVYPVLDLDALKIGVRQYVYHLEEVIIQSLKEMGIEATRLVGAAGVWVAQQRKICAIGIKASRGITMHGLALNINTYLPHFEYIIACGLKDKASTSIEKELGTTFSMEEVAEIVLAQFSAIFNIEEVHSLIKPL